MWVSAWLKIFFNGLATCVTVMDVPLCYCLVKDNLIWMCHVCYCLVKDNVIWMCHVGYCLVKDILI